MKTKRLLHLAEIELFIDSTLLHGIIVSNSKIVSLKKLHDNLVEFIEGQLNFLFACKPKQPV